MIKILLDMNLPPSWVERLTSEGWSTIHWSTVGDPRATDREIMKWAKDHGCIVFTHDLDFGALLAATQAGGPSVIQIRSSNVMPASAGNIVARTIRQFQHDLEDGALITVEESRARIRVLPLG